MVEWKEYGPMHNSWEPWTSLTALKALTARYHTDNPIDPTYASGCPAHYDSDSELPRWRVLIKRTSSGRDYKTYFGPRGEVARSRSAALQIASLYGDPPGDPPDYL